MVELTQMSNRKQSPHTLKLSIAHPTCEGAHTSLEAIKLRDESISPLECDLAVSSWIPDGGVGVVALQIEFAITMIQGKINLGAQNGQPNSPPQRDIDDAQEQRLKEKLSLPITPHSQFQSNNSNLLEDADHLLLSGRDLEIDGLDALGRRFSARGSPQSSASYYRTGNTENGQQEASNPLVDHFRAQPEQFYEQPKEDATSRDPRSLHDEMAFDISAGARRDTYRS